MKAVEIPTGKARFEAPTVALAVVIYGLWLGLTYWHRSLPIWVLAPLGAWTVAWQMSLQHEVIHGHPTRSKLINTLVGTWPLSLWLPYEIYRRTHIMHHNDSRLTDPLDDPESYYWTEAQWRKLDPLSRLIVSAQSTLLGRVTLGPAWSMFRFWQGMVRQALSRDHRLAPIFARHALEVALVLFWVVYVCKMPFWTYFWAFAYAGTALATVRSYAEHRAEENEEQRTAIVEKSYVLGTLFLFNNLHVAHHVRPAMPWYQLPEFYRRNREAMIARNGGLLYNGYFDVARRYLLRPHDRLLHPFSAKRAA
jgi:fatty acid desaturase